MKDLSIYFQSLELDLHNDDGSLGAFAHMHTTSGFPEIKRHGVAIFSVPEYRNSAVAYESIADTFRSELYQLQVGHNWTRNIYDLGIIAPGEKIEDTYFAVAQVVAELVKSDVIPILVGGSQDLTLACYKGFEALEQMVNICAVDSRLDVGDPGDKVQAQGFVSHMLMQRPCFLFNYANIGMQRPLVRKSEVDLFEKLYFDVCRLGEYNMDYKVAEPHLRNSDILSIDFNSIKSSDADPARYTSANGFRADQICQLSKYAGISDKLNCLGIFDVIPGHSALASNLLAQIIWYFLDGVSMRFGDFPMGSKKNYTKFHVHLDDFEDDLVFYKSDKSDRWWLEVKYLSGDEKKYERHTMVPCNQHDYQQALSNVIPDLWWRTLQKLS
jgi:arginase family enzyme